MNKNENDKFILEDNLNNLGFLALGVFISSCYSRNFSALNLLQRPIQIVGKYNKNKFYFEVPLWLPIHDCFLKINNQINSKVKDIALPKRIITYEKNRNLIIDLTNSEIIEPCEAEISYFPWYRFATEPMDFNINNKPTNYIARALIYSLKSAGIKSQIEIDNHVYKLIINSKSKTLIQTIELFGENAFENFLITHSGGCDMFNIGNREIQITAQLFPKIFKALKKTIETNQTLQNINFNLSENLITLQYQDF